MAIHQFFHQSHQQVVEQEVQVEDLLEIQEVLEDQVVEEETHVPHVRLDQMLNQEEQEIVHQLVHHKEIQEDLVYINQVCCFLPEEVEEQVLQEIQE